MHFLKYFTGLLIFAPLGMGDVWQIQASGARIKSGGDQIKLAKIGANGQINDVWNLGGRIQISREPNEVMSAGFVPGANFLLSSLWVSELTTVMNMELEFNRFTQSRNFRNRTITGSFNQRALHLSISQELNSSLEVGIFSSVYVYNASGRLIGNAINRRKNSMAMGSGIISGFPKNTFGLELSWQIFDSLQASINASRSRVVDTSDPTNAFGGEVSLGLGGPSMGLSYGRSKTLGSQAQHLYGLGLGYSI